MKTDFEFIKDKFDESGVKAPESMNEEFVLDKIKDTQPVKTRKPLVASLSAAAAVAVVTAVAVVAASVIGGAPKPVTIKGTTASLSNFKSSDDVKKAIREINDERSKFYGGDRTVIMEDYAEDSADGDSSYYQKNLTAAAGGAVSSSADYGHNATYTQYTNVDEADSVKTDGRYIYYLSGGDSITVFSTEGKKSKKVAEIKTDSANKNFNDFYISGDNLIATVSCYPYHSEYGYYGFNDDTAVEIYNISDIKNIKLTDSFTQSGSYCSSRMIGSMMYVVSTHYADNENDLPCAGKTVKKKQLSTDDEATPDEIPCEDIYTVDDPSEANFLVVSSINTSSGAQAVRTKAILGSAETVYCDTEHLFVTAPKYDFNKHYGSFYAYDLKAVTTQLVKVDLNNNLDFTATAKVNGSVDNQYALDEKDGYLRVATTDNSKDKETNCLYILDSELNQVGKTRNFAEDERIKAVRYIGDTAYVITYEETDPLFVIDTADVKNPKILGEVKISGFSTLLVPVDENTLLGIGYHTQDEDDDIDMEIEEGIKLALFDVSDKTNPKVLDEKIFKNYYSEVQYNPKALLVNFERNDYTIPYSRYTETDDEYLTDYGVINFRVENGEIKIVDEYKSDVFGDTEDYDASLERCAYVGDYIYMVGTHYDYTEDKNNDVYAVIDAVEYK